MTGLIYLQIIPFDLGAALADGFAVSLERPFKCEG